MVLTPVQIEEAVEAFYSLPVENQKVVLRALLTTGHELVALVITGPGIEGLTRKRVVR